MCEPHQCWGRLHALTHAKARMHHVSMMAASIGTPHLGDPPTHKRAPTREHMHSHTRRHTPKHMAFARPAQGHTHRDVHEYTPASENLRIRYLTHMHMHTCVCLCVKTNPGARKRCDACTHMHPKISSAHTRKHMVYARALTT